MQSGCLLFNIVYYSLLTDKSIDTIRRFGNRLARFCACARKGEGDGRQDGRIKLDRGILTRRPERRVFLKASSLERSP